MAAVGRLRARFPDAEVAMVSHGDVIKAVLAHFLAVPLDLLARIEIAPGSRSEVVALRIGCAHPRRQSAARRLRSAPSRRNGSSQSPSVSCR